MGIRWKTRDAVEDLFQRLCAGYDPALSLPDNSCDSMQLTELRMEIERRWPDVMLSQEMLQQDTVAELIDKIVLQVGG